MSPTRTSVLDGITRTRSEFVSGPVIKSRHCAVQKTEREAEDEFGSHNAELTFVEATFSHGLGGNES